METTDTRLLKGIKEANSQHFCDPVQFARYKIQSAGERKQWNLYAYWVRVEQHLMNEEAATDLQTASDAYEFSDADNGL